MEWRRDTGRGTVIENPDSNKPTSSKPMNNNQVTGTGTGVDLSIGNNDILPKKSSTVVTDKLTKELDLKYEMQSQILEQQKRFAQEQLEKVSGCMLICDKDKLFEFIDVLLWI